MTENTRCVQPDYCRENAPEDYNNPDGCIDCEPLQEKAMDFKPEEDPQQYLLRVAFALDEGHRTKLDFNALDGAAMKHAAWANTTELQDTEARRAALVAYINSHWDVQIMFEGVDYLMLKPARMKEVATRQGRAADDGVFYVEEV